MPSAPASAATDIRSALSLEKIDENLFRSKSLWTPPGARGVYGGQIIGQALIAAHATVDYHTKSVHSLHSYFLLAGDSSLPAIYHVERVRDGKSFSTRNVQVKQRGRAIFSCLVSFHRDETSPLSHQFAMPQASGVPP